MFYWHLLLQLLEPVQDDANLLSNRRTRGFSRIDHAKKTAVGHHVVVADARGAALDSFGREFPNGLTERKNRLGIDRDDNRIRLRGNVDDFLAVSRPRRMVRRGAP